MQHWKSSFRTVPFRSMLFVYLITFSLGYCRYARYLCMQYFFSFVFSSGHNTIRWWMFTYIVASNRSDDHAFNKTKKRQQQQQIRIDIKRLNILLTWIINNDIIPATISSKSESKSNELPKANGNARPFNWIISFGHWFSRKKKHEKLWIETVLMKLFKGGYQFYLFITNNNNQSP